MNNVFFNGSKEIKIKDPEKKSNIEIKTDSIDNVDGKNKIENFDDKIKIEKNRLLPRNGGEWTGEAGNSEWKPDPHIEPGDRNGTNPEHKTWEEIKKKYDFESIAFHKGVPDFSEIEKGEVKIDDFSDERDVNFDQADEKLADIKGCTPEEVAKWRKENKYTWHECEDCKTMQKVPTEVHGNISHSGGISKFKAENK